MQSRLLMRLNFAFLFSKNTECSDDTYCSDSGVCIDIPPDKIVRAGAAQQEEKLSNGLLAIILAAALLGVQLLMLGAFLIVRKCKYTILMV